MITVLRHEVPPFRDTNIFEVSLHQNASVIHVDQIMVPPRQSRSQGLATGELATILPERNGRPTFEYYLWAVEDMSQSVEKRRFWFVRDGDNLDMLGIDAALYHVNSFRSTDGSLWCHVFEVTHLPDDFEPAKRIGPAVFRRRPGGVHRAGAGETVR